MCGLVIVHVLNLDAFNFYSTSFKTLCLYYFTPGHLQDEAKERYKGTKGGVRCVTII